MSVCPPERGSVADDIAMSGPLIVLSEPEEEANAESDAITGAENDAETGVTLSETGGLEIVEGAVAIDLEVF